MEVRNINQLTDYAEEKVDEICSDAKFHQDYWTEEDERKIRNLVFREKFIAAEDFIETMERLLKKPEDLIEELTEYTKHIKYEIEKSK